MRRSIHQLSVVGVDPTASGLAFVFFEGGEILDWGHRSRGRDGDDLAVLDRLIDGCAADLLVLEDPEAAGCRRRARVRRLLRRMAEHASGRGVRVSKVARDEVRAAWRAQGITTKQGVAVAITAQRLPELATLVPPPRKAHMSEHAGIKTFDAASLVLFALGSAPPADAR